MKKSRVGKNFLKKNDREFWKAQRILVISPHADDEVFGCGGTMAKARHYGSEVYVLFFTVDDLKSYEDKGWVRGSERAKEIEQVSKLLEWNGHHIVYNNQHKHLKLDRVPQLELVTKIEREGPLCLDRLRPSIVAIPAASYNQDHRALYQACFTALRIHAGANKYTPDQILVYDSPTLSWSPGESFQPNFYVDISAFLEIKLQAVRLYTSQKRHPNDPCSLESSQDLARVRGREVGRAACEAYRAIRLVY